MFFTIITLKYERYCRIIHIFCTLLALDFLLINDYGIRLLGRVKINPIGRYSSFSTCFSCKVFISIRFFEFKPTERKITKLITFFILSIRRSCIVVLQINSSFLPIVLDENILESFRTVQNSFFIVVRGEEFPQTSNFNKPYEYEFFLFQTFLCL